MTTSAHNTAPQIHAVSWPFPCSNFNGKEKDWESGFHYYGARYYWSELLTGWLSVDPMADKYPGISPYAYCAWNPVKLVDPDGRDTFNIFLDRGRIAPQKANGDHCVRFIKDGEVIEDKTITGIKSQIKYERSGTWNAEGPGVTDYLMFNDAELGWQVFDIIDRECALSSSAKEWDYHYFNNGGGELSSSGRNNKMVHAEDRYTNREVSKWHHFHPKNTSESWFPSYSDQEKSRDLCVPSYLHSQGNCKRFDQVVGERNQTPSQYKKKAMIY